MSKWCETCYRNEMTGEWKPCGNDCPVFGKYFEDLAKMVIKNDLEKTKNKTIADTMTCPECGSDNCYEYSTDEAAFNGNGNGHYYADCTCNDCLKNFRIYTDFKYSVVKVYTK